MSDLHWYLVAARRMVSYERTFPKDSDTVDNPTHFMLFRAYSWKDAFDQIRKDRLASADFTWGLYSLEKDGSYWDGNRFLKPDTETLKKAGFCAVEQAGSSPSS